jgi:type II secretory pathway component PulC
MNKTSVFLFASVFFILVSIGTAQDKNSEITCEPNYKNGKLNGFVCPQLHEESLLAKLGLKENDVIVEFDGTAILSFKDMQVFYEQLHRRKSMKIKFKRGDNFLTVVNQNRRLK